MLPSTDTHRHAHTDTHTHIPHHLPTRTYTTISAIKGVLRSGVRGSRSVGWSLGVPVKDVSFLQ